MKSKEILAVKTIAYEFNLIFPVYPGIFFLPYHFNALNQCLNFASESLVKPFCAARYTDIGLAILWRCGAFWRLHLRLLAAPFIPAADAL